MELTTLDKDFLPVAVIDVFESAIWVERYYGDSEVQLVVPATSDILEKLAIGTFLSIDQSKEVMILETHDISGNQATIRGISILKWLNNRFIRTTANHEDRYWYMFEETSGAAPWSIIDLMCVDMGERFGVIFPLGIPNPAHLKIPNLQAISIDDSGPTVELAVPFGPIYDAIREIAVTYQVGMTITLEYASEAGYLLGFSSYRGIDRSSNQSLTPPVRFSSQMESFANTKEFQSISDYATEAWTFAPENPGGLATSPGWASRDVSATGFDLRAIMVFEEDLTTDTTGLGATGLLDALYYRAAKALEVHKFAKIIDGEIVPTGQFQYGVDYNLGDIIEVQGYSGIVQTARVVEYIRSKDNTGEKAYPTLEMIV